VFIKTVKKRKKKLDFAYGKKMPILYWDRTSRINIKMLGGRVNLSELE
jgi:hypothetical protein